MKKKIISLMMAAVLPVMMMAGCGSADNTQSGSSEHRRVQREAQKQQTQRKPVTLTRSVW